MKPHIIEKLLVLTMVLFTMGLRAYATSADCPKGNHDGMSCAVAAKHAKYPHFYNCDCCPLGHGYGNKGGRRGQYCNSPSPVYQRVDD